MHSTAQLPPSTVASSCSMASARVRAFSRMKPRSSGKARVSRAPSSATGRHSLSSGLMAGLALATTSAQRARMPATPSGGGAAGTVEGATGGVAGRVRLGRGGPLASATAASRLRAAAAATGAAVGGRSALARPAAAAGWAPARPPAAGSASGEACSTASSSIARRARPSLRALPGRLGQGAQDGRQATCGGRVGGGEQQQLARLALGLAARPGPCRGRHRPVPRSGPGRPARRRRRRH